MSKKRSTETFSVILTHENTDLDALASLLAAHKLYPEALPILPLRLNRNLRAFLALYGDDLPFVRREELPRRTVGRAIIVDTQSPAPIKGMNRRSEWLVIDHHPLSDKVAGKVDFHGGETGATTTLLVEKIRERHLSLSFSETSLLLLGIYEDTGSLTYTTTTPRDIYAAAWLLEQAEADDRLRLLATLNRYLRQPLTEEQMTIYSQLIEKGKIHHLHGYTLFIAGIDIGDYLEELSTPAHKVNDVLDPDASFMFFAHGEVLQLIARSTTEAVNVAEIARHFGGGGHSKAAAGRVEGMTLAEAELQLLTLLKTHIRPSVTVRDIMSFGVHTLEATMTLREAEKAMRRYGHEGFPVIEQGRVIGVLTRREIEKAIGHDLGGARVGLYMRKGDISIQPGDSIQRLQEIMVEHDLGQVPVVEAGQVIGIVTRTDLIKNWSAPAIRSSRQEIAAKLQEALPASRYELAIQVRDIANRMGYSLYVVGGFVRDLLLGVPDLDLDLVVEGEAIPVARALAAAIGGRVTYHERFGTARVILHGTQGTNLPPFLDLATARTEFYERPSALPQVESSSIKQDLHRRDFTINAMAICLDQDRYGELLDFYGGAQDLQRKLIRVLHSLSFIDDATRMLRAVRLEQRLGFQIEKQTAELIDDALEMLHRVSGERLRHELDLIFEEEEPRKGWRRLAELGILRGIHPALDDQGWCQSRFNELQEQRYLWSQWLRPDKVERAAASDAEWQRAATKAEESSPLVALHWGLVAWPLDAEATQEIIVRLKIMQRHAEHIWQAKELAQKLEELAQPGLAHSRLYRLLQPYSTEAVIINYLAADDAVARENIARYESQLRWIKPQLGGDYLRQMGIKPGPIYKRILGALQDALLDNQVRTSSEEEAFIEEMVKTTW